MNPLKKLFKDYESTIKIVKLDFSFNYVFCLFNISKHTICQY